jgi:ribosomal-protein-alanine N-acetyltransferase
MTLRPAAPDDAAALAHLHAAAFERPWSAMEIHQLLSTGAAGAVACEAGFILWRTAGGEAEILTLAVDPAHRRAGLGRALTLAALKAAAEGGSKVMFLEVAADNPAAIGLYEKVGFASAGVRKAYYVRAGGFADALVLRRVLNRDDALGL